jgi:hypothetical protein
VITKQTPGVYIDELPVPVTITGAPTSTPAFLGQTEIGEENKPTLVTGWNDFIAKFGRPVWRNSLAFTISQFFKESGGVCYVVKLAESPSKEGVAAAVTMSVAGKKEDQSATVTFRAASKGTWGNGLWVSVHASASLINIKVFVREEDVALSASSSSSSIYDNAKIPVFGDIDKALIRNLIEINAIKTQQIDLSEFGYGENEKVHVLEDFVGVSGDIDSINKRINNVSSFIRIDVDFKGDSFLLVPVNGYFHIGGADNDAASSSSGGGASGYTPGVDGVLDYSSALDVLEKVEGISLISMPDTAFAMVTDDASASSSSSSSSVDVEDEYALTVMNDALARCSFPQNWFYVVDPPATKTIGTTDSFNDIIDFKNAKNGGNPLTSPYGAMYWPWIVIVHPVTGSGFFPTPASGAIIGRYVYTDQTIGVHQPAAGVNYGALPYVAFLDVDSPITDDDQSAIYPEGINVIRNRINYGIAIWGARTLSHDPAWRYVNVRRLFNYVETSLVNGLQWAVFQANNRLLWESVKREVIQFLVGIWKSGGLFGDTQSQAFRVTCDETNNSNETIAQGYLYVRVEIAPVRPGEFIVIEIAQKMADSSAT